MIADQMLYRIEYLHSRTYALWTHVSCGVYPCVFMSYDIHGMKPKCCSSLRHAASCQIMSCNASWIIAHQTRSDDLVRQTA